MSKMSELSLAVTEQHRCADALKNVADSLINFLAAIVIQRLEQNL